MNVPSPKRYTGLGCRRKVHNTTKAKRETVWTPGMGRNKHIAGLVEHACKVSVCREIPVIERGKQDKPDGIDDLVCSITALQILYNVCSDLSLEIIRFEIHNMLLISQTIPKHSIGRAKTELAQCTYLDLPSLEAAKYKRHDRLLPGCGASIPVSW